MQTTILTGEHLTVDALAHLPHEEGTRYELLDGELHMTTQPHWEHQYSVSSIAAVLWLWNSQTGAGRVYTAPGIIFSDVDVVAPDVVWVRRERLPAVKRSDGKFHAAPDLVVEVLSPGRQNEERDRIRKLHLYNRYGVAEYWIVDRWQRSVEVYRRAGAADALTAVLRLGADAHRTSPLLPGFAGAVASLFEPEDA